ncbi:DNA/RNA non-specific endonuclease [Microbacterium sp. KNMS]
MSKEVKITAATIEADAATYRNAAQQLESAVSVAKGSLSGVAGMAGDDNAAEDFAGGGDDGYDATATAVLQSVQSIANGYWIMAAALENTARMYRAAQSPGAGQTPTIEKATATEVKDEKGIDAPSALGPGLPGVLGEFQEIIEWGLQQVGVVIPTGDEDKLARGSTAWITLATTVRTCGTTADGALSWIGGMSLPQQAMVQTSHDGLRASTTAIAGNAESLATRIDDFVEQLKIMREQLKDFLQQMALELAVDLAITGILGALTFGLGAIAGSAKAAATVVRWAIKIKNLIDKLKNALRAMRGARGVTARAALAAGREGLQSAISSSVSTAIMNAAHDENDPSYQQQDVGTAFISAFAGGAVASPVSRGLGGSGGPGFRSGLRQVSGETAGGALDGLASGAVDAAMNGTEFNPLSAAVGGMIIGGVMSTGMRGGTSAVNAGRNALGLNNGRTVTPNPAGDTSGNASPSQNAGTTTNLPDSPATGGSVGGGSSNGGGGTGRTDYDGPTPGGVGSGGSTTTGGGGAGTSDYDGPTPGGGADGGGAGGDGGHVDVPTDASPDAPAELPGDGPSAETPENGSAPENGAGDSGTDGTTPDATQSTPETTSPDGTTPESATPDGATPESATPDGTTPEGATPDGTTPEGATPDGATPESATPDSTTPDGTTPDGTTPEGTTPDGTTPESTTPDSTTPDGATPDSTTPEGTTPETTTPDGTAPEATSPEATSPEGASPESGTQTDSPSDGSAEHPVAGDSDASPESSTDSASNADAASPQESSTSTESPDSSTDAAADSDQTPAAAAAGRASTRETEAAPADADAGQSAGDGAGTEAATSAESDADASSDADESSHTDDSGDTEESRDGERDQQDADQQDAEQQDAEEAAAAGAASAAAAAGVLAAPRAMPFRGAGAGTGSVAGGHGAGVGNGSSSSSDSSSSDPMSSPDQFGNGWDRAQSPVGSNPIDPAYGDPRGPGNSGQLDPRYTHPGAVRPDVQHLVTDPAAPYGRDDAGNPLSQAAWESRYTDANNRPVYPGNDGGDPGSYRHITDLDVFHQNYGGQLDRMGGPQGDYFSLPGTPFEARALPPGNLRADYTIRDLVSLPPGGRIEVSRIAPAFGQPGGGLQVRILDGSGRPMSQEALERGGHLRDPDAPDASDGSSTRNGAATGHDADASDGAADASDGGADADEPSGDSDDQSAAQEGERDPRSPSPEDSPEQIRDKIDEALGQSNTGYDPYDLSNGYAENCGNVAANMHDFLGGQPIRDADTGTLDIDEMEARTGLPQTPMTPDQIEATLRAQGPGSHCVVGVDRGDDLDGHWFNAVFDGEQVWVVDGQDGTRSPWPPDEPDATNWDASIDPSDVVDGDDGADADADADADAAAGGDGSGGDRTGGRRMQPVHTGQDAAGRHTYTVDWDRPKTPFAKQRGLEPNAVYEVKGRGTFYTDASGTVTRVETSYSSDGLNPDLHNPQPSTTYVVTTENGNSTHTFETDHRGRTIEAHTDSLDFDDARRSESVQSRVGRQGGADYDGGHLFGNQFGGGGESVNLVAMLRDVNQNSGADSFYALEQHWADLRRAHPQTPIEVRISPIYDGNAKTPDVIQVRWTENGQVKMREFFNDDI